MISNSTDFNKELSQMARLGPGEQLHIVTDDRTYSSPNYLVTRRINLKYSNDRFWLIEQIKNRQGLPFTVNELKAILDFIAGVLDEEWLTVYRGGIIALRIGPKILHGFHLFNHLIPLGHALILLKDKPGFMNLTLKLNNPKYDRLSAALEAFAAARYAAAGYVVELEPKTTSGKTPDFRVLLNNEWIYFECKRINVQANKSVKKNLEFINKLEQDLNARFKDRVPSEYRIDIRLGKKPSLTQIQALIEDLERMTSSGEYQSWVERDYGKYGLIPRDGVERPAGYPVRSSQITVGTTPTPISAKNANVIISFNPFGSKIEQRFRIILRKAQRQIPSDGRGILIIQGLDETNGMNILQERLGHPDYRNIVAGVAIGNGVQVVRRDDHTDIDFDFIGKCVSHSLFYDYDIGNY